MSDGCALARASPSETGIFFLARTGFAVEFRHGLICRAGYSTDIVNILHNGKLTQSITKKYPNTGMFTGTGWGSIYSPLFDIPQSATLFFFKKFIEEIVYTVCTSDPFTGPVWPRGWVQV